MLSLSRMHGWCCYFLDEIQKVYLVTDPVKSRAASSLITLPAQTCQCCRWKHCHYKMEHDLISSIFPFPGGTLSSHRGSCHPVATWLKWPYFFLSAFSEVKDAVRAVGVRSCRGLCCDGFWWGTGLQGCLVLAAAGRVCASITWCL